MAAVGCLVGVVGAQLTGRLLAKFMYDTRPSDPLALGLVVASVIAVALVACAVSVFGPWAVFGTVFLNNAPA